MKNTSMFQGIIWCVYRLKAFRTNKDREMFCSRKHNGSPYTKSKFIIIHHCYMYKSRKHAMNKRNKDRKLLTSSHCSFAYTSRNKTTSPVTNLFLLTNEFPPFVKKMPIWLTWKTKENFITYIWYLARRKRITDILASKSEWMIELHRAVCPFWRYNFCKELCQRIPTENIASDSGKCNSTLNRIYECIGIWTL